MRTDQLSKTFYALADTTRREILARLDEGEKTVNELADGFGMSLPAISKHLKVLQQAGLIEQTRHAQRRPCRRVESSLSMLADWLASQPLPVRR
ncbi:metalloregulator ArsR/SmtB family transcription factor [Granulosicoccaceae sp. 1_MG-2023]|nr:metalloregulator ArsR/SmtB family transcription factor [Granulosicoccaceae sp. 1_MG-2023]